MGFGILWFLIVIIIVVRYVNAAKGNDGRPDGTRPPQANRPGMPTGQGKWTSPQSATPGPAKQARPVQPKGASYGGQANSGQPRSSAYGQSARQNDRRYAMPARPVQSASYPVKKQSKAENTILQKARANASEHFDEDTLEARGAAKLDRVPKGSEIMRDQAFESHIHSGHGSGHEAELRNRPGVDDYDTYHLMDEVNDLIVKGYSGSLEFDRDFLAEGMDMLSRISM